MGKENNVKVAALLGAKEHAIRQVEAGVDILVVSGTEVEDTAVVFQLWFSYLKLKEQSKTWAMFLY